MDEFELHPISNYFFNSIVEINDDFKMDGSTYNKQLPSIKEDNGYDKEKASNLFTAMEKAIEQEQAKQGSDRLNAIERQWESRRKPQIQTAQKKEESESSDSFELDGDTGAFTGVYTQTKNSGHKPSQNPPEEESDEEFGIVDPNSTNKFKKLDKNKLLAFVNDPNITIEDRKEYQKRLNDFKGKK